MISPKLIRVLAVFVPPLSPLEGDIAAADATFDEALAIARPALERIKAGQPAFLEAAEEEPKLVAMLPRIITALETLEKITAVGEDYTDRLERAVA